MKIKSIVSVLLLALAVNLSAQVGIQAGYANVNEVTKNTTLGVDASDAVNGFVVGPVSEYNLMQNLDLRFGVLYTLLLKSTDNGALGTSTYSGHFVDVPVQAQYSFEVAPSLKIFAFAGPTINFGLAQQTVTKTTVLGNEVKATINHYDDFNNDDKGDISRFDLKLGLGAGARYDKFELRVGYDWGMLDMNTTDPIVLHRNQLTAAIVYHL